MNADLSSSINILQWIIREISPEKVEHYSLESAKAHLKMLGLSQRKIAGRLGVSYEHLNRCLNGHRKSQRLLDAIAAIKLQIPDKHERPERV